LVGLKKIEQLDKIREIIHHERYNVTGLADDAADVEVECKGIAEYVDKEDKQADEEDEDLKTEENSVGIEIDWVNTHPCDCVWAPWSSWAGQFIDPVLGLPCLAECGGSETFRERGVEKPATNGGVDCPEDGEFEVKKCNMQPCAVNCEWAPWGEWTPCPEDCGNVHQFRHRDIETQAANGGDSCVGQGTENKTCDPIAELRLTMAELKEQITVLQTCAHCNVEPPTTTEFVLPPTTSFNIHGYQLNNQGNNQGNNLIDNVINGGKDLIEILNEVIPGMGDVPLVGPGAGQPINVNLINGNSQIKHPLINGAVDIGQGVLDVKHDVVETVGDILQHLTGHDVLNPLVTGHEALTNIGGAALQGAGDVAGSAVEGAANILENLIQGDAGIKHHLINGAVDVGNAVLDTKHDAVEFVGDIAHHLTGHDILHPVVAAHDAVTNLAGAALEGTGNVAGSVVQGAADVAGHFVKGAANLIGRELENDE